MKLKAVVSLLLALATVSCAQVPKESVELSATVGRDIAAAHKAHRALASVLFARMKHDVNRFVDDVYAPFQIRYVMEADHRRATSADETERRRSLLLAMNAAFKPGAPSQLQSGVLVGMSALVESIREDVEQMRTELLAPLEQQEAEVTASVDRAYQQIHYANSIVTGHLASVVKVHDAQGQVLDAIGLQRDLGEDVHKGLAEASSRIAGYVEAADDAGQKADEVAAKLKVVIGELQTRLGGGK